MEQYKFWMSLFVVVTLIGAAVLFVGDGEEEPGPEPEEPGETYTPVVNPAIYEDLRNFTDLDPIDLFNLSARDWAVFKRAQGGNCCEHYLATTQEGWIVNLGGEYPVWSEDRGKTWNEYIPTVLPSGWNDQHELCRTLQPSGLEDWEGLGEGSVVQATNGDIIAMSWYPYPSYDGKADRFYAYLYRADLGEWSWCQNNWHEPFYDRSWQVEVKGPITRDVNGIPGNWPWASVVISNFWHQSTNEGGTISVDGLNYDKLDFPGRNSNPDPVTFDLNFTDLGAEWDYATPHREMRALPLPSEENGGPGGALFPRYFTNGDNLWLDTELQWHRQQVSSGTQAPSEFMGIDSSGAIFAVDTDGTKTMTTYLSLDGGNTWTNQSYTWPTATNIESAWDFKANGVHDLLVLTFRVQETDELCPNEGRCDRDIIFQVRDYHESLEADTLTMVGKGDLDATRGAGAAVRFDFSSLAILPDGGAVVAYHDSTDEDPLFAVEVELPERYL